MPDPSNTPVAPTTQDAMLYAVAHDEDGSALELTVYEDGEACSVRLTKPLVDQLVQLLTHRSQ